MCWNYLLEIIAISDDLTIVTPIWSGSGPVPWVMWPSGTFWNLLEASNNTPSTQHSGRHTCYLITRHLSHLWGAVQLRASEQTIGRFVAGPPTAPLPHWHWNSTRSHLSGCGWEPAAQLRMRLPRARADRVSLFKEQMCPWCLSSTAFLCHWHCGCFFYSQRKAP